MATITTILASDIIASSRVTLNTNFANLNTDKVDINSTYADPAWITSLAGSKITGNIGGNAATATALATARTIAGVSFDGTANIAIPSTGLSDSSDIVRGASSVASGQVLYGTGAGVAGSNTNFRYFVGTGNMVVGTTTDDTVNRLQVAGSVYTTGPLRADNNDNFFGNLTTGTFLNLGSLGDASNAWIDARGTGTNVGLTMRVKGSGSFTFTSPTHGLATLAADGTFTVRNQTPTTGVTQLIVRAGAGQSTTNLLTVQNSGGTALVGITGAGSFFTGNNANATGDSLIDANGLRFGSTVLVRWSNNLPVNAADISLSRAGVNIGQFGDGGSNSNGLLYLKGVRPVGSTVANLPTASGNTGMMATVTDATVTTIGTTVAGGGGNTVLVWSNGTNWRIYAN